MRDMGCHMAEKHVYRFGMDEHGNNVTEVAGSSVNEAKWITGGAEPDRKSVV